MIDLKKLAKKANGGDKEALTILVLEMPHGAMKDMEPEQFAEKMANDDVFSEYVEGQDRFFKDSFYPHGCPEEDADMSMDMKSDIKGLLDAWTERDPDTPAGGYYHDLLALSEKHLGKEEGNSDKEESY
tara:strand:- start:563 stop:949 length:387 start_codon:yes stop_codon:yes gene_type:complete